MGDQQTRNLGWTIFQKIGAKMSFPVVAGHSVHAPCALVLLQAVVAMRHEMAYTKEAEIEPGDCLLGAFSRVARD